MPSHPDRVRTATLPEWYQFGDARLFSQGGDWLDVGAYYKPCQTCKQRMVPIVVRGESIPERPCRVCAGKVPWRVLGATVSMPDGSVVKLVPER